MLKTKQTPPTTPPIRRRWLMGLTHAFFHPPSEAEVRATIEASQETGRLVEETIKRADELSRRAKEELQQSATDAVKPTQ